MCLNYSRFFVFPPSGVSRVISPEVYRVRQLAIEQIERGRKIGVQRGVIPLRRWSPRVFATGSRGEDWAWSFWSGSGGVHGWGMLTGGYS